MLASAPALLFKRLREKGDKLRALPTVPSVVQLFKVGKVTTARLGHVKVDKTTLAACLTRHRVLEVCRDNKVIEEPCAAAAILTLALKKGLLRVGDHAPQFALVAFVATELEILQTNNDAELKVAIEATDQLLESLSTQLYGSNNSPILSSAKLLPVPRACE